jgi:hypothetical protein
MSSDIKMSEELYKKCSDATNYLQDPLFVEMFEVLEAQYTEVWRQSTTTESREHAWLMLQALNDVHKGFRILAEKKEVWDLQEQAKADRADRFKLKAV